MSGNISLGFKALTYVNALGFCTAGLWYGKDGIERESTKEEPLVIRQRSSIPTEI